jgi:hypothetical protein
LSEICPAGGRSSEIRRRTGRRREYDREVTIGIAVALARDDAIAVGRRNAVSQNKMYKVLTVIEKKGGGHFWMRVGSAFRNKDDSLNVYLDAVPKTLEFTIRELDEDDLRKRDAARPGLALGSQPNSANAVPF